MPSAKKVGDEERGLTTLSSPSLVDSLHGLQDVMRSSIHPRGDIVFSEGQPVRGIYLLATGRAKISISSAEGRTAILRVAQPGDLLGLMALLQGQPYEETAETIERCRIDFINRHDFLSLLDRSTAARAAVSFALAKELSGVLERTRLLVLSESALEKLTRLLVSWSEEFGEVANGEIRLNHGLTQEEIAQMICVSRETVSRLFAELRRNGVVRQNGVGIFVRNRAALESIARHRQNGAESSV